MKRPTLLVVDDDADIRECLSDYLADEGYQVRTASDGLEALTLLQQERVRPCLMLLDLMMPRLNGWQVLEQMEAHPELARLAVVVVSASHQTPGAVPMLRKPIDIQALLGLVHSHCRPAPRV